MISPRIAASLLCLVLLVAGCADDSSPTARDEVAAEDRSSGGREKAGGKKRTPQDDRGDKAQRRPGRNKGDEGGAAGGGGGGSGGEEGAEDDRSSRYAPAPGLYTYAQEGFEEFCDAARCERENLPPRQKVQIYYEGTKGDALVVVTETRASANRFTKTTTLHSESRALVTKVKVRVDRDGFTFNNNYQPDPPVEAVRYPLRAGDRWSGSWKDSTSGDYTVEVGASETVQVGGRTVQAFPVRTTTTFKGEIEGRGELTAWIDPATAVVVKSEGHLDVSAVFGRYNTSFSTSLRDGPDYR